ncbi:MAG: DNA-binding protein [Fibrobacteria bacterium]|nr:DNA-binding protein [Fibrobacteria bacterium]
MRKITLVSLLVLISGLFFMSCQKEQKNTPEETSAKQPTASHNPTLFKGTVKETMNSGGYTYVLVNNGTEERWAAGPQAQVQAGDTVTIPLGSLMAGYHSKTLDKTFDKIYFVNRITKAGSNKMPIHKPSMSHGSSKAPAAPSIDFSGIKKATGGNTVAETWAAKDALTGKEVTIRAKIVKANFEIMGKNWYHIQDGTGENKTSDLTVTSQSKVQKGATVLVKGIVAKDKDLGSGYFYPLIIENAVITAE